MGVTDQTMHNSKHASGHTPRLIAIIDDDDAMQDSRRDQSLLIGIHHVGAP